MKRVVVVRRRRADAGNGDAIDGRFVSGQTQIEHLVADRHHEPLRERRQRDEQADRPDDARVHRRLRQAAQQDPVECQTEQWREQEHADDHGRHDRDTESRVQLVIEIRGSEGDGTVRKVENARRRVRQHQARRHDRVDRAGDQSREDEVEELLQGVSPLFPRRASPGRRGDRPGYDEDAPRNPPSWLRDV